MLWVVVDVVNMIRKRLKAANSALEAITAEDKRANKVAPFRVINTFTHDIKERKPRYYRGFALS